MGDHPSRPRVSRRLEQRTRLLGGPPDDGACSPCTGRGLASRRVTTALVGSYPTVSPLPAAPPEMRRPAVSFLFHFPSAFAAWGFPSVLPCGVRTFLGPPKRPAATRPAQRILPLAEWDELTRARSLRAPRGSTRRTRPGREPGRRPSRRTCTRGPTASRGSCPSSRRPSRTSRTALRPARRR